MLKNLLVTGAAALALAGLSGCGASSARSLAGVAPEGTQRLLVIDSDGNSFETTPAADRSFKIDLATTRPISLFVIGSDTRVLRVAATSGATPSITSLPNWQGEVNTAQLQTADANDDGADEEVIAENNPLEEIDSDADGTANLDDDDDDNDGENDDGDDDSDGDGEDDHDGDLDSDDDGRPDLCDNDDDNDGTDDSEDEDHGENDDDGDGVDNDHDHHDDSDADDSEDDAAEGEGEDGGGNGGGGAGG